MAKPAPAAAPAESVGMPPVVERPSMPSALVQFAPLLLIVVIFYFLMIRPQQKQQKETEKMQGGLKRGDRVITSGGLHGVVADFKEAEKAVVMEVSPGVRITVNRTAVATVRREAQPPAGGAR